MPKPLEPEFCDRCGDKFDPSEEVVQGVQTVDTTTFGDEVRQELEGPTAIVHPGHWPPKGDGWRETYRGPLSGIRPTAT